MHIYSTKESFLQDYLEVIDLEFLGNLNIISTILNSES